MDSRALLVAQPSWNALLQLVCTHQPAVVQLPHSTRRMLAEACTCAGLASPEAAVPYMAALHVAISGGYHALLSGAEFGPAVAVILQIMDFALQMMGCLLNNDGFCI